MTANIENQKLAALPNVDRTVVARLEALIGKGDVLLATTKGSAMYSTLDPALFSEWETQSLSFLADLLGTDHTYVESFRENVEKGFEVSVSYGQGILRAVKEEVELGHLARVRALITADVFSDFLEMADHLLDAGYKDPAASLVGAVLENGLRTVATDHHITVKTRDDLGSLTAAFAERQQAKVRS